MADLDSRDGAADGFFGHGPRRMPVHVIVETWDRRRVFSDRRRARAVWGLLSADRQTLSAVLMPDHLHWIVLPEAELANTVGRFKSRSCHSVLRCGWRDRLWQRSYFATPLRSAAILRWTVRYTHANPVRAGLVTRSADYSWCLPRGQASR